MEFDKQPYLIHTRGQFNGENGWLRTIRYGFDSCTACQKLQSPDEHRLIQTWPSAENGYIRDGRQRSIGGISRNQTWPAVSTESYRWVKCMERGCGGQRCHGAVNIISITINEQGTRSNYKGNLYVIGSIPILQAKNFAVSSTGRAKEFLVPWYIQK